MNKKCVFVWILIIVLCAMCAGCVATQDCEEETNDYIGIQSETASEATPMDETRCTEYEEAESEPAVETTYPESAEDSVPTEPTLEESTEPTVDHTDESDPTESGNGNVGSEVFD